VATGNSLEFVGALEPGVRTGAGCVSTKGVIEVPGAATSAEMQRAASISRADVGRVFPKGVIEAATSTRRTPNPMIQPAPDLIVRTSPRFGENRDCDQRVRGSKLGRLFPRLNHADLITEKCNAKGKGR